MLYLRKYGGSVKLYEFLVTFMDQNKIYTVHAVMNDDKPNKASREHFKL